MNQSDEGKTLAREYSDNIVKHANDYINTSKRSELQFGIFEKDAAILNLQREKINMLQELVDLDMKMYGQIAELTQDILNVQNCEILNGRVRELALWERDDSAAEIADYQNEVIQNKSVETGEEQMEKKRVLSKDELEKMLHNHLMENQSGRGKRMLDLSNCVISNYVFKGDLSEISFDGSDLRYCEFRMTKGEQMSFQNTVLSKCKMTQAEFDNCNFNHANIKASKITNSMFRHSSFDTAYMQQCSILDSVFYHTSFANTRMREFSGSENIFHECGNLEDTVRVETVPDMDRKEAVDYANNLRDMLNNEGYTYSWELAGIDLENYTADFSVKIFYEGENVEEERYSALLDRDTYAISHIDTRRQGDVLVKMFMPEMNTAVLTNLQKIKEQEQRVRLKFPYMTRSTFMAVKDEIKRMGAEFDQTRKEWYVKQSSGKETIINIQEYISGHDEGVYLKLPPAGPKEFRSMIEQLKQDGARYNADKKLWFITEKSDRNKFQQYLPIEKESVHEKLNGYKEEAEKKHADIHEMGSKGKEKLEHI